MEAVKQRSYIDLGVLSDRAGSDSNSDSGDKEGRRRGVADIYQLARFVRAVQSRTRWRQVQRHARPPADTGTIEERDDSRNWGSANWWQNLRLPYWTMFASGDWDTLDTVFEYYKNICRGGNARSYFNHTGIFFTETKLIFGAWGGIGHVPWKGAYNDTSGCSEFVHGSRSRRQPVGQGGVHGLNAFEYTRNEVSASMVGLVWTGVADDRPLLRQTCWKSTATGQAHDRLLRQHYRNRTTDGKMVIWPTQSLETYWCSPWDVSGSRPPADCCVDDMPTVGAMHALLQKMRRLPQRFASSAEQKQWAEFQAILPPLPTNATHLLPRLFSNVSQQRDA